jgi:2-C-methyl-D-erythritol 4-phosphate cytidylyltransferase
MRSRVPKPFLPIRGRLNMIDLSLEAFRKVPGLAFTVVVTRPPFFAAALKSLRRARLPGLVVEGGVQREDSVLRGLLTLPEHVKAALIHDAARPLVTPALVSRVLRETLRGGACVPGVPVQDTVKEVRSGGRVVRTLERSTLTAVQTPQGFRLPLILGAFLKVGKGRSRLTDDASVAEAAGFRVRVVPGDPLNFKVTTPEDLQRARHSLKRKG